jgi:long-chain fatty acid transport protein
MRTRCFSFITVLMIGVAVSTGYTSGVRIPHQDAAATARGDAFVATADNASTVFYNPAGITQLEGMNARLGDYLGTIDVEHHPPGGGSFGNKDRLINVPNAYYTWSPKNSRFSLGVGVNSPFGLSLEYEDDAPSRIANKKAKLTVVGVAPVVAVKITDTLSIGIGPTFNYGEAQDQSGIATPGDGFRFRGADTAIGFNAGILWKPHPQHSFGIAYHSAMDFDFSGHSQVTVKPFVALGNHSKLRFPEEDATLSLHLPQFIVAGYSFRPTPDWNFEVNVDWTDWDSLNSLPLHQQRSGESKIVFNWRSGFIYEAGVTRSFSHGFHLSAGYAFSEANNPESNFSPAVPDGDRHILSAGLGQGGDGFNWDLGYQYSATGFRTIDNDGPADGRWRLHTHAILLSLGYHF